MLLEQGEAALNLEMTDRVYRTEYSVFGHTKLMERVTGIGLGGEPDADTLSRAQNAFAQAWDMCVLWSILVGGDHLGAWRTRMGHAVYAGGGSDWDARQQALFTDEEDAFAFDPEAQLPQETEADMIAAFERHYAANRAWLPDMAHMTGIYVTCISGMIELLGWDMLLTCAGVDPDRFGALVARYAGWIERYFIALARSRVPLVMVHDDMVWTEGAFIAPKWMRRYVFPVYRRCIGHLRDAGKKILFTSDGNYTQFVDDIAACGVHGFVLEPLTDMAYIAERYGRTHVFIGNADTRVLLTGSRDDIRREVQRCMDIGKRCPGFIMAVGNHIPPNTPVDSCLYYDAFCKQLGRR